MKRPRFDLARLLDDGSIGLEAGVQDADHLSLKLWLRLLACSTQVETEIRRRLRERFGISLSRFDYLAQLHRHPEGLRMNTLSRFLMVTGGSVTGLTDELEKEGLVARDDDPEDRRSYVLRLTAPGRKAFERMAHEHEAWVIELFGGLEGAQKRSMYELLGRLRVQLSRAGETTTTPKESP
jgi:DNA-binding MarR family transcriptional regulator